MLGLISALEGLSRAEAQLSNVAAKIARSPAHGVEGLDIVDLSAAAVALLQSRNNFEANTEFIKTADEMEKTLIDTLA